MAKICLSLFNSLLFAKEVSYMCIVNTILFSLFFFQPYRHIFFSFKVFEFITKSLKISFFFLDFEQLKELKIFFLRILKDF